MHLLLIAQTLRCLIKFTLARIENFQIDQDSGILMLKSYCFIHFLSGKIGTIQEEKMAIGGEQRMAKLAN